MDPRADVNAYPVELDSMQDLNIGEFADIDLALGSSPEPQSSGYNDTSSVCLIVEPDQHIQRLVHTWLMELQVGHTQLGNGEQAISACSEFKYSVIFMDLDGEWQSSVKTGLEATRNIRLSQNGLNKHTPIIGWTRDGTRASQAASWGVNEVLLKPFSKEHISAVVKTWLGGSAESMDLSAMITQDDLPPLDISQLAPPDFIISGLVRPKTARVLVVEDCTLTQHVIIGLLSKMTTNVSQAFDGEQAVQMCQQHQFDLILMDMAMPKLNGLEATGHIRSNSKNVSTPIIAFTSSGSLEDYSAYGVNDMLQKPFTTESLSTIFDKWTAYIKQLDAFAEHTQTHLAVPTTDAPTTRSLSDEMTFSHSPSTTTASQRERNSRSPLSVERARDIKPQKLVYQPLGLGLPMPSLPSWNHGCGKKGSAGKRKKGVPRVTHNLKEQQRRKHISQAAEDLSKIIPNLPAADKATVYLKTVEYVKLLRSSIPPNKLKEIDDNFLKNENATPAMSSTPSPIPVSHGVAAK